MRRFKALSPIVAVLLLIIIAAVASTLLFVWFSGYFSTTASKAAEMQSLALSIKKAEVIAGTNATATNDNITLIITLQNLGTESITVNSFNVFVNGQSVTLTASPSSVTLAPGKSASIVLTGTNLGTRLKSGDTVNIAVVASGTGVTSGSTYSDSDSITIIAK